MTIMLMNTIGWSQGSEFKIYPNGLIYSEEAMFKLSYVVDSLNLKFKYCDINKKFYGLSQTVGHHVILDTGNILQAKIDIENHISFDEFVQKYPLARVYKNNLIVRSIPYNNARKVRFEEVDIEYGYGSAIVTNDATMLFVDCKDQWVIEYNAGGKYTKESIEAFYFPNKFESIELPSKYCSMISYADCLVDTTTTKFKKDAKSGSVDLPKHWQWLPKRRKAKLLDELRSVYIIGACSQDSRPRKHAFNIALLSAETYNWNVFLRSHLDILNDNFDRVSDGSYALEQRNTYVKELETLNINVSDLIFGIAFSINNPAKNHYYGDVGRIGRALAETKNHEQIENDILAIITDSNLDDFNRLMFCILFQNYIYSLKDETAKLKNKGRFNDAIQNLPEYYRVKISLQNEE
jgi:hypothetical protein